MQIKEVVIDKTELFNKRRASRTNVRPIKSGTTLSIEKQRKIQKLMDQKLHEIELIPYKLLSSQQLLLLKLVTRNFFDEISPLEILQMALQDKGEQLFTKEQYSIAEDFTEKFKDKIEIIIMHQLNQMDKLAEFADRQALLGSWRKYVTKFDALRNHITDQLRFFQNF